MLKQCCDDRAEHERILARGLEEVAAELRLVDAADLVAFIRAGRFGNLSSLVDASTEMYFKPGAITFRHSGMISMSWSGAPSIALDMEFRHSGIDVFFQLVLEPHQAGVEIEYISFDKRCADARTDTERLAAAISAARFTPPRAAPSLKTIQA